MGKKLKESKKQHKMTPNTINEKRNKKSLN